MPDSRLVATHYTHGGLLDAIKDGVERLRKTPDTVSIDELGPVDEFHIGGRVATQSLLEQIGLGAEDNVLDVGCGLGGASRFATQTYGCQVSGIDLTEEFIETGNALCSWVGLEDRVRLVQGDATNMAYPEAWFDKAYMIHVGMNIADKKSLAREIHRILKPGGVFAIYDIMRVGQEALKFPVPWAVSEEGNALESPAYYKQVLLEAGFQVTTERNRRDFALDYFARLQASAAAAEGPPPLGTHILMGETAPTKVKNMVENVSENRVAPVEMIAQKPA